MFLVVTVIDEESKKLVFLVEPDSDALRERDFPQLRNLIHEKQNERSGYKKWILCLPLDQKLPRDLSGQLDQAQCESNYYQGKYGGILPFPIRKLSIGQLTLPAISRVSRAQQGQSIPLTSNQKRILSVEWRQGLGLYNMPVCLRMEGDIDQGRLEEAIRNIIRQHDSLRAGYSDLALQVQCIFSEDIAQSWKMHVVGLDKQENLREFLSQESRKPFNFDQPPLLRAYLVKHDDVCYLLAVFHHSVFDGRSQVVFLNELARNYGEINVSPFNPINFQDYAFWSTAHFNENVLSSQLVFWENMLRGVEKAALLPDYQALHNNALAFKGKRVPVEISVDLAKDIKVFAQKQNISFYKLLLTVIHCLIHCYASNQESICIGTVASGRARREIKRQVLDLIGFLANTLPTVSYPKAEKTFGEMLVEVDEMVESSVYSNSDVSLDSIVSHLKVPRDLGNPLFDVVFVLQDPAYYTAPAIRGIKTSLFEFDPGIAKFPLAIELCFTSEGDLRGFFEFDQSIYKLDTVVRLVEHFEKLLKIVIFNPSIQLGYLYLITDAERQQLKEWNLTSQPFDSDVTIMKMIHDQMSSAQAIYFFNGLVVTYEQLWQASVAIALEISALNLPPHSVIGVCIPRSVLSIFAMFGVFLSGHVLLPLEASVTEPTLFHKLINANVSAVIAIPESASLLRSKCKVKFIILDNKSVNLSSVAYSCPAVTNSPAYIEYTSGTTATVVSGSTDFVQKGIRISHAGLSNWALFLRKFFAENVFGDKLSQLTTYALAPVTFDAFLWEVFCFLAIGSKICLADTANRINRDMIVNMFQNQQVNLFTVTPSILKKLDLPFQDLKSLRYIVLIGEVVSFDLIHELILKGIKVFVGYGPTESAIGNTWKVFESLSDLEPYVIPPVGKSIPNTGLYILNSKGVPVPPGIPGEVYISGNGILGEYLDPTLTKQGFPKLQLLDEMVRVFKTGDRGRLLQTGELEYLGRVGGNRQIKFLGVRIDLDKVGQSLKQISDVSDAYVMVRKIGDENEDRLVAYLETKQRYSDDDLRKYLMGHGFPSIVVSTLFHLMEEFPVSSNGKLDTKKLPNNIYCPSRKEEYPPNTPLEKKLAVIWREVLKRDESSVVNLNDDFFYVLGGESTRVFSLLTRISEEFDCNVDPKDFYRLATIEAMRDLLLLAKPDLRFYAEVHGVQLKQH